MTAANVVPFKAPASQAQKSYLTMQVIIDETSSLQQGDLVAWQFREGDIVMLTHWWGPTGRDGNGRFVAKGSPEEHFSLDVMRYRPGDGLRILGRVVCGGLPGALTP
jgi:hypothetical protein